MKHFLNRRRFIVTAVILSTVASTAFFKFRPSTKKLPELLDQYLKDKEYLAVIGLSYLQSHSPTENKRALSQETLKQLEDFSEKVEIKDLEQLEALIRKKIDNDYNVGNIDRVDGWILSQTEVDLSKLMALEN